MRKKYPIIIVLVSTVVITLFIVTILKNELGTDNFEPLRIAHAGGGIRGVTYTNSYEALDKNRALGGKYFELDFSFTKDNQLVCLHDWHHSFERTFGYKAKRKLTLEEFEIEVKKHSEFTKCTLDGLVEWMHQHSSAKIVTDVKEKNVDALKIISQAVPDAPNRIIPQIYFPGEYAAVKELGYKQIILTLYRYDGSNDDILDWARQVDSPIAVAMRKSRAVSSLPKKLGEIGVPTYVHTVNDSTELNKFHSLGISEIYTDFLLP